MVLTDSLPVYRSCRFLGHYARAAGIPYSANPFPLGLEHYAWMDGWRFGEL